MSEIFPTLTVFVFFTFHIETMIVLIPKNLMSITERYLFFYPPINQVQKLYQFNLCSSIQKKLNFYEHQSSS